jgi:hypothetical protein
MCLRDAACGSIIDDLVADSSRKQIKKFRQVVLATVDGVAATNTAAGTTLEKLQATYNQLADQADNYGKTITGYCHEAVLNRLMQLKDNNARPLFDLLGVCPVTGCREICYGGMKLKSVEPEFAPITGTTTKITSVIFVSTNNVFGLKSPTTTAEVTWDKVLNNTNNKIVSLQVNACKIPTILATSTAVKVSITL